MNTKTYASTLLALVATQPDRRKMAPACLGGGAAAGHDRSFCLYCFLLAHTGKAALFQQQ